MRILIILALCSAACYAQGDSLINPDNFETNGNDFDGTMAIGGPQIRQRRNLLPGELDREIERREAVRREFERREAAKREVQRRQAARREEEQRINLDIQRQEARFAVVQREAERRLARSREAKARREFEELVRRAVLRRQMALEQEINKAAAKNPMG